jgi:signal transduction histidine kinase
MSALDRRLERDFCARGFIRAAQYFANMLASADVLAESRELIRSIFAPDLVCFCEHSPEGGNCTDCALPAADRADLLRTVDQVIDTGLMAMEHVSAGPPMTCVVLPVTVRGRTEVALVVGYSGTQPPPPHALDALLGVVGLVGATRARQLADRELVSLAEERAARAIAEVTERRERLLSEASKALFASFDYEPALASVARLLVPQLGDWCLVDLRDGGRSGATREVAAVHVDASKIEQARALRGHADAGSTLVAPIAARSGVFGEITLGVSGRRQGTEERALAEEIGRRAGTAVENARLYRQAQEAIGVRDQFIAVASHELKTPLTALLLVISGVERALQRLPDAPALMRSKIEVLSRQAHRLDQLVVNLLDVARIEAGRLHVHIEDVDLCATVREVVERHEQQAARAGCALEVVAGEPVTGAWDRSRLDQVVSNLLSNAIKYGAGKPISVVVESSGGTARLSVADHGIGIAPGDHERVFQRFERAIEKGFSGMGLGLWITREIVTRLGGSIAVESRLGEGACFTVELPIRRVP